MLLYQDHRILSFPHKADIEVFGSLHELFKTSFLKKALSRWLPFTFAKHLSVT